MTRTVKGPLTPAGRNTFSTLLRGSNDPPEWSAPAEDVALVDGSAYGHLQVEVVDIRGARGAAGSVGPGEGDAERLARIRHRAAELVDLARAGEDHLLIQDLARRAVEEHAQVGIAPALAGAGQCVVGAESGQIAAAVDEERLEHGRAGGVSGIQCLPVVLVGERGRSGDGGRGVAGPGRPGIQRVCCRRGSRGPRRGRRLPCHRTRGPGKRGPGHASPEP